MKNRIIQDVPKFKTILNDKLELETEIATSKKEYLWTIVSDCHCGCGETLIDWVKTKERDNVPAAIEAMKKQRANSDDVAPVAIFKGHHMDQLTQEYIEGRGHK